jgi:non-heme chloroperoxidase
MLGDEQAGMAVGAVAGGASTMPDRQEAPHAPRVRWPSDRRHRVTTPDGLDLCVREAGNPDGWPILFIHGLAQAHLSWSAQFTSPLARRHRLIAYDLRGHGESAKPLDAAYYQDGRRWADDVRAVIDGLQLDRPVVVGWSLGGRVLRNYLIEHGDGALGGLNFLSTRPFEDPAVLAPASQADLAGRPDSLASRIDAHVAFLRACFHRQPSDDEFAIAVAYNAIVPQEIRAAISGWSTSLEATRAALGRVTVPTLVTHGRDDGLIRPRAAEMTAGAVPGARISWYDDCGHSPFAEHATRYNDELDAFVDEVRAHHGRPSRA